MGPSVGKCATYSLKINSASCQERPQKTKWNHQMMCDCAIRDIYVEMPSWVILWLCVCEGPHFSTLHHLHVLSPTVYGCNGGIP